MGGYMQRLIIELRIDDGENGTRDEHKPVMFSSKENFLVALQDKLNEIKEKISIHKTLVDEGAKKFRNALAKGINRSKESEDKKEFAAIMEENNELIEKAHQLKFFYLGGQQFSYCMFLTRKYKNNQVIEELYIPEIWTVDEYFAEVEQNINNKDLVES